jgi:MFS family permease
VFAAFLLTQTAMTVVFGKLSDLIGRKKVMLGGIAVFLVGEAERNDLPVVFARVRP